MINELDMKAYSTFNTCKRTLAIVIARVLFYTQDILVL